MSRIVLKFASVFVVVVLLVLASMMYVAERAMQEQERLAAAGDVRGALAAAGTAARYNPFDPEPYTTQASILQVRERPEDALDALQRAARRDPENYTVYISMGNIQFGQESYADAEKSYRRTLELNPRASSASEGLAQVLVRRGKLEEARAVYEDLEERRKIDTLGRYDLGRIYVRTGDPERGYKLINQARRQTEAELENLEGAAREGQLAFIESMQLSAADALVVQEKYNRAYRLVEQSASDQAPGLLQLIATDPVGYRESVINSEIY